MTIPISSKHGRWTVIGPGRTHWNGYEQMLCRCECGEEREVRIWAITGGYSKSCGCGREGMGAEVTHGLARTPEYRIWQQIKGKCLRPEHRQFWMNGARGVVMDPHWAEDFQVFIDAVGRRPSSRHVLARNDLDGDFIAGNVKWVLEDAKERAPRRDQAASRREVGKISPSTETWVWRGRERTTKPGGGL